MVLIRFLNISEKVSQGYLEGFLTLCSTNNRGTTAPRLLRIFIALLSKYNV